MGKKPKRGASQRKQVAEEINFEDDFANFLGDNKVTDEEESEGEEEEYKYTGPIVEDEDVTFWKTNEIPEQYPLDHVNVQDLVNMLSRIRLVWPEDLPRYDELEYSTDPERAKCPSTFYHNTDKEKLVLWHAENFRRQFIHKFPNRRPPVIAPRNECGCQKLFPTYINPTALGYPEFLEAGTTIEFFKDFFKPMLMAPPTKFPARVRSHVTAIKKRLVNVFEIAVIAASVLIGAGYDAYVVDGFASKTLCTMNVTEDYQEPPEPPLLPYEIPDEKEEDQGKKEFAPIIDYGYLLNYEEEPEVPTVSPSKYRFKKKAISSMDNAEETRAVVSVPIEYVPDEPEPPPVATPVASATPSAALQTVDGDDAQEDEGGEEHPEENEEEEEDIQQEGEAEDEEEDEEEEMESEPDEELPAAALKDRYHRKRTHAWILILPGGLRDVEEAYFLEPFSGTARAIKDPNFLSVEAVFNQNNYWINIQPPVKNLRKLNWDFDNPAAWSKLLVEPENKKKKRKESQGQPKGLFGDEEEEETQTKAPELFLTMPCSWTTELDISQEDYDMKYPDGTKTIEYNDAIVEVAAPYSNPDGLVRKVIKFICKSRDPEDVEYIEEQFMHRKDKLKKRKWFREGKMLHEYFDKGRKDALKEHVHVSGRNKPDYPRDLYYYANAHPKQVSHRRIIKKGMIEHFEDREDLLYYKVTLFGGVLCSSKSPKNEENKHKARHVMELLKGGGITGGGGKKKVRRQIIKIVEKYHRNEEKEATEDIAEKHMLIEEGKLRILFHYSTGHFSRNTLEFYKHAKSGQSKYAPLEFKPEDVIEYQSDMAAEPMNVYKKFLLIKLMDRAEKTSIVASREAEDEVAHTVGSRVQEDWTHEIEPDAFAGYRNEEYLKAKLKETQLGDDEDEEQIDYRLTDFTTPFFEKYGLPRNKKEEILMKKRIMLHEKVKILRRAYLIKELYDKESSALREKQEWYESHIDLMNPMQEEDFEYMYKERLFQMHVLEQRMIRHQQDTPKMYYNLLVQILRHPQLNRFTNRKVPPPPPPIRELTEEERARIIKELAKLKDCCQFYSYKFDYRKKRISKSDPIPQQHLEAEANIEKVFVSGGNALAPTASTTKPETAPVTPSNPAIKAPSTQPTTATPPASTEPGKDGVTAADGNVPALSPSQQKTSVKTVDITCWEYNPPDKNI